ncbi:MAG TPA: hypothetical protein VNO21_11075, partial [Polyangiaceae bacterium]|nr:hypothetical protein [Polyangiaceae bacterium]
APTTTASAAPATPPSSATVPDPASAASGAAKEITPGQGTGGGHASGGQKWAGGGSKGASATAGGGSTGATAGGTDDTSGGAAAAQSKGPKDLQAEMRNAVGTPKDDSKPAAAAAATAPFDRGAAQAALGNIDVTSCKKSDGPAGSGHLKVTFQPSGTVSAVDVDQPPFSGTAVGGCIAAKFRSAHVPAFSGGPVTVGKGFNLN